jgi:hypothetical protein
MIIIWKGFGFLVVIFGIGAVIIADVICNLVTGNGEFTKAHNWPVSLSLLLAAVAVYFIGRHLNHKPGRVMIDKATGREIILRRTHSLFFIPMEYWAFVFAAISIWILFVPHK